MKVINIAPYAHRRKVEQSLIVAKNLLAENLRFMRDYRYYYTSHDQQMMGERVWELMFMIRDLENELQETNKQIKAE